MRFLQDTLKWVIVMRRCLVVANQTLQTAELRDELRQRVSAGPCSFFVIVPDTKAAQYDPVAAGGVLPQPGMWWWATYYARPVTDEEATVQARERLSVMLDGLAALGVPVEGDLGSSDPLEAIKKVCADRQFDEIIVTTFTAGANEQTLPIWIFQNLFRPNQAPIVNVVATVLVIASIIRMKRSIRLEKAPADS